MSGLDVERSWTGTGSVAWDSLPRSPVGAIAMPGRAAPRASPGTSGFSRARSREFARFTAGFGAVGEGSMGAEIAAPRPETGAPAVGNAPTVPVPGERSVRSRVSPPLAAPNHARTESGAPVISWPTAASKCDVRPSRGSPPRTSLPCREDPREAEMIGPATAPERGQPSIPKRSSPNRMRIQVRGITSTSWCDGNG
jgi:hypothetical protein